MMKKLEIILAAMLLPLLSACEKKQVECTYEINIVDDDATRDAVRYLEDLLDEDVFTINAEDEATADAQAQERFDDVLYDVDEEELEALLYPEGSIELVLERIIPAHKEIDSERWRFSEGSVLPPSHTLSLNHNYATVEEGQYLNIVASYGDEDVTSQATWYSSDKYVAVVSAGVVTGVAEGTATISCEYNGQTQTCTIQVIAVYTPYGLLDGSDYYIFQIDQSSFDELNNAGKVTSDMRTNGAFEGEVLIPEDATRVNYYWNPSAEVAEAPQSGVNSFGLAESWFSIAAASPTPVDGWGNICGGLGITTATDTEIGKLQNLTPDHVFVVVLKGKYTPTTSLQISMTPPAGGDNVTLFWFTNPTGEYNDGDWEVFTITYPELIYMGIDLSQPITTDFWYPWAYVANGAGNRVDVDCVFFYVPGEMSAIDETGASSGKISCDEPFRVINLAGQDVTAMNGELQGTYIVVSGDKAVKVVVD